MDITSNMYMHAERIVIFGMSCSGKTTFAKQILSHKYLCFDRLFKWHLIETLNLSITENLLAVRTECEKYDKFVLDGWHLAGMQPNLLPSNSTVYVLYCDYEKVLSNYQLRAGEHSEHWSMFWRWYGQDFSPFNPRYFVNSGSFVETSHECFSSFLEHSRRIVGKVETPGIAEMK